MTKFTEREDFIGIFLWYIEEYEKLLVEYESIPTRKIIHRLKNVKQRNELCKWYQSKMKDFGV